MRLLFFIGLLLMSACGETFEKISPEGFNQKINKRMDLESAEDLMKVYYNPTLGEGNPTLTVDSRSYKDGKVLITLIHDGLLDDSVRAMKIIMIAKKDNGIWTVFEIKKNWKCREGRGHVSWGIDQCS